jgi:hypothetical protein
MSEVDSRCGSGGAGTVKNSAKVVSKEFRGREFFQPRGDWAASALATGLLLRSLLKGLPPLIALPTSSSASSSSSSFPLLLEED